MEFRTEKDFLGEVQVPAYAYYGIQTMRAVQNFPITGVPVHKELLIALAEVKKAAALANMQTGKLREKVGSFIVRAADEVIGGQLMNHFIVDCIQGGAGTSINMAMNEVLANRALELMGENKGDYFYCSPNNEVNMSQSTNDTIPTALRISAYRLAQSLISVMETLRLSFMHIAQQYDHVVKMGRTHLQDAVPIRVGQEFKAYANVIGRDRARLMHAAEGLLELNMGATAVGTGLNAKPAYITSVTERIAELTGIPVTTADDLVDATQNTDVFTALSAALKIHAVNLSKMCNDIRLMASGPKAGLSEIKLPPRQPGSSIMPGKVNPVMPEVINQISFQVMGNDHTICLACEAGQFELNVMMPVVANNLLQSLKMLRNGLTAFNDYAIVGLEVNEENCRSYVDNSYGIITALNPHLGYDVASRLVKEAEATGMTIRELIEERQLLTREEIEAILDPFAMTTPGIAGEVKE
jgi:aspartate ammonia-lyase